MNYWKSPGTLGHWNSHLIKNNLLQYLFDYFSTIGIQHKLNGFSNDQNLKACTIKYDARTAATLFVFQQILKKWTQSQCLHSQIRHYLDSMMMHVHKMVRIIALVEDASSADSHPYSLDEEAFSKWPQSEFSVKQSHCRVMEVTNVNTVLASIEIVSQCVTDFMTVNNGIVTNSQDKENAAYANVECAKETKMLVN